MNNNPINEFLESLSNLSASNSKKPTFLSIIKKPYAEMYVSKILAYLLDPESNDKNPFFLNKFCELINCNEEVSQTDIVHIYIEKSAYSNKIDVFIEVNDKFTILIENKINSYENGDQTDNYYQYCEEHYKDYNQRYYVYLKPEYNTSKPNNDNFKTLNYENLSKIIECTIKKSTNKDYINKDYINIAQDFINHIKEYFMLNITETDLLYLNNIDAIEDIKKPYENKMSYIKEKIVNCLSEEYNIGSLNEKKKFIWDNDDTCFRFYKEEWYIKNLYYLYCEIKYNKNKLNDINCQVVLRRYGIDSKKEISSFQKMIKEINAKDYSCTEENNVYYIINKNDKDTLKNYATNFDIDKFKDTIKTKMKEKIELADSIKAIIKPFE